MKPAALALFRNPCFTDVRIACMPVQRHSRLAMLSLGLALLIAPGFGLGFFLLIKGSDEGLFGFGPGPRPMPAAWCNLLGVLLIFGPSVVAAISGCCALVAGRNAHGQLRGRWMAWTGIGMCALFWMGYLRLVLRS